MAIVIQRALQNAFGQEVLSVCHVWHTHASFIKLVFVHIVRLILKLARYSAGDDENKLTKALHVSYLYLLPGTNLRI